MPGRVLRSHGIGVGRARIWPAMSARMTTMQRIAIAVLLAGFVLMIASVALVMGQISQMVPYSGAPAPDSTIYERTLFLGCGLIGTAFVILFFEAWRTKRLAEIWDRMIPKTRIQKFGFGLAMAGLIMAIANINSGRALFGNIVMLVGMTLWQWSFATKKDPAKS